MLAMVIRLKQESGTQGVHALHAWCAGFFVWNMLSLFSAMLKTQKSRLDGVITAM
ncbi:hypothetical protein KU392_06625 [Advenella alkanexedens]|uniref:Uncharacterized protein n=1 Tax=Advenella alkanexedens TaxID=1481665 RepID=A0ABS6NMS2_9BURK|nr:hypothetical protein [Advenella alkanexedens]MBV4396931.1 hypothetical protein [Advenella alkanexedens]